MFVNAGMWFERFVIIVTSIARDFLPSSWGMFHPTWVDLWTFAGTFGLFLTLFLLFIRFLPMIAIAEVKGVTPAANAHTGHGVAAGYAGGETPEPTHLMPAGQKAASGTRANARPRRGVAVPATSEHPAEPIQPAAAANQGQHEAEETPPSDHGYHHHRHHRQTLRPRRRTAHGRALFHAGRADARRRVQTLGRVLAVPDPRHGRRHGPGQERR